MKRVLLVSPFQYGYHTDMDMYFKYLSETFEVDYLCVDHHLPRVPHDGHVIYVKGFKTGFLTKVALLLLTMVRLLTTCPHFTIVTYFRGCSLLARLFGNRHLILDIRTGSVHENTDTRIRINRRITQEAHRFRHIMVVSEGLARLLGLKKEKTFVVPLGADAVITKAAGTEKKGMESMSLLYVGTFDGRNIEETIKGFKHFYEKYKNEITCRYTLIGYSSDTKTIENIRKEIADSGLQGVVQYLGRIPHTNLGPYLESHNIGVSFVPKKECFEFQPPTKTYEYLKNGLICIATSTHENARVIYPDNGILVEDNYASFSEGLEAIYKSLKSYDPDIIMASVDLSWQNIVNCVLLRHLEIIDRNGRGFS